MIGRIISHYRIIQKLGEGGMGVVYKAEDTKLKRTVALKFLPKDLEAHEQEKARFLQEAQAASALNHPNICAIHTLGEYEGSQGDKQQFIDMEFVEGNKIGRAHV
jgi:serine/threonine protein kinase